jgi:hypothetical protein
VSDWIDPHERKAFQAAQARRIGEFLKRLATDDALLLRYIKDQAAVLREEQEDERLIIEDVALLLEGDYSRVSEVMSKGEGEPQWWVVGCWLVGF